MAHSAGKNFNAKQKQKQQKRQQKSWKKELETILSQTFILLFSILLFFSIFGFFFTEKNYRFFHNRTNGFSEFCFIP
ncbi:MAG: hypothetical protein ACP5OZ_02195 [Candidatus Woesearchaeota archaeon]